MSFVDDLFKKRLEEVDATSLLPFNKFQEWADDKMGEVPYRHQSQSMREYSKYKLYLKRSIDRKYLRLADEKKTEGKCIKVSHDGLLYPESQILVRHGIKLWVHDLSIADFVCFGDEEIKQMMDCLRVGKWAVEKNYKKVKKY